MQQHQGWEKRLGRRWSFGNHSGAFGVDLDCFMVFRHFGRLASALLLNGVPMARPSEGGGVLACLRVYICDAAPN